MNLSFFGSDQEGEVIEFVEIEAQTAGKTNERSFLFFFSSQFEFEYFLGLQLVLHETPIHHTTIRGNGVEVVLFADVRVPSDLPDWVSMLLGSHCGFVDRFVVLVSHVIDKNSTVIETSCQQSR